jgi:hypothetical protein
MSVNLSRKDITSVASYASFLELITALGSGYTSIVVAKAFTLIENVVVPENIDVRIEDEGGFDLSSYTITFKMEFI